jgi:uncharacterized protein (DUF2345 family)
VNETLVPAGDPVSGGPGDGSAVEVALGRHVLRIERTADGGVLRLRAADGQQPLEIEVTAAGPVLRLRAPLSIALEGGLTIDAETVALRARGGMQLASGGGLDVNAGGALRSSARTQEIHATVGDVRVTAHDDVVVDGERIKLNC